MSPIPPAMLALALCLVSPAQALVLRSYAPANHDRFTGFSSAPVPNATFIHSGLDLSGVGFHTGDTRKQFTLVAPEFFVGANHFRPPVGSTVRFVTAGGGLVDRTVVALHTIPNGDGDATDLLLGRLSAPVVPSSGVKFLPYLNLATEGAYVGQNLVVLGKLARGGVGRIGAITDFGGDPVTSGAGINTTRTMQFNYSVVAGSNNDAYAEGGDSGSPSLVSTGGVAAIVGTHTAVLQALGTITTVDTFVPHYVDELNAVMEAGGYHMTAATPGSASLTLTQTLPGGVVRAGYPFSVSLSVANQSATVDANNLKVWQQLPAAAEVDSVSGNLWVPDLEPGASARRGGLGAAANTVLDVVLNFPDPGVFTSSMSLDYDEGAAVNSDTNITVLESYRSWSRELVDADPDADPDGDGAANLLEYALGSDPGKHSGNRLPVTDSIEVDGEIRARISYLRRTDAAQRALSYSLEASLSLEANSWSPVASDVVASSVSPAGEGLEMVEAQVVLTGDRRFFRLRVELDE